MKKNITRTLPNKSSEVIGTIEQEQFLGPYKIQIYSNFTDNPLFSTLQFLMWLCVRLYRRRDRLWLYVNNSELCEVSESRILIFNGNYELTNDVIDKALKKLIIYTDSDNSHIIMFGLDAPLSDLAGISINGYELTGRYYCNGVDDWIIIHHNELFKFEWFTQQKKIDPITIRF